MSEPTERCGWTIQRSKHLFDWRLDQVLATRGGIALYFNARMYDRLDDIAFAAIADHRAEDVVRREARP